MKMFGKGKDAFGNRYCTWLRSVSSDSAKAYSSLLSLFKSCPICSFHGMYAVCCRYTCYNDAISSKGYHSAAHKSLSVPRPFVETPLRVCNVQLEIDTMSFWQFENSFCQKFIDIHLEPGDLIPYQTLLKSNTFRSLIILIIRYRTSWSFSFSLTPPTDNFHHFHCILLLVLVVLGSNNKEPLGPIFSLKPACLV